MPTAIVTIEQARLEIAEVEKALSEGYPPVPALIGSHQKTAIRIAAERLGVVSRSLADRIGRPDRPGSIYRRYGLSVDWTKYVAKPEQPEITYDAKLERKLTAANDRIRYLEKALREAHREQNTADIIREIVGHIANAPRTTPPWLVEGQQRERGKPTPEVVVTCWADWHLGEVVEPAEVNGYNAYNMAIAEERIERLIEKTIKLCRFNHTGVYAGAVVNLVGDNVSGGLHPELKSTDEEEVIPASIKAVDWISAGLRRMADEFKRLYVPCTAGNHGRNTAKPEFKRYYKKNFDWLIYMLLQREFADDSRIVFDIRPSNDVHYKVFNERYLLQHGDMLGVKGGDGIIGSIGPIMRGEVKKAGQSSALGLGFDKIVMGHWHQRLWLPRAIVAGTLKGFDEYAKNQLGAKPDRPTQPLWFVHPRNGQTAHWDVYVDQPPAPAREWISFEAAA